MANQDFLNAFNDSIDRLAAGQTVEDCLRLYPNYAAALRPLLETGRLLDRLNAPVLEVEQAKTRGRIRFEEALRQPLPQRRTSPFRPYLNLAAAVLVIVFFASIGAGTAAQNSLPGDSLYGLKQITESLQQSLSGDPALASIFNERRQDEIKQLLALNRVTDVSFEGTVVVINSTSWLVDELPLHVPADTAGAAEILAGDRIQVAAYTTPNGELIASSITLIEAGDQHQSPTPTATLIPSSTATTVPSATPTLTTTPSATPSATQTTTQTATVTASHTATDSPTMAATPSPASTPTNRPAPTPSPTQTATVRPSATSTYTQTAIPPVAGPTLCATLQPTRWVEYRVQPGDTLSGLATNRGITLEQLLLVNCLTDPHFIVVGDTLILPRTSTTSTQAPGTTSVSATQESGDGTDDKGGSSESSSDSSSPGSAPTDDHGGNSGSGSSGGTDDNGGHGSDD